MKFYFYDKSEREKDIILEILHQENIYASVLRKTEKHIAYDDIEDEELIVVVEKFTICIDTTLEYFDFIKMLVEKKINILINLERNFLLNTATSKKKKKKIPEITI